MYNTLLDLGLQLKDAIKNDGIYNLHRELKREQFLSNAAIQSIQEIRLKALLKRAYNDTPYYKALLDNQDISVSDISLGNLAKIPLLTREKLQNNFENILCRGAKGIHKNSSGGSTGNPVNFYQDLEYRKFSDACELLFYDWMGVSQGDKKAILWGSDRDLKAASRYERIMRIIYRIKILDSFTMTDEKIKSFLEEINEFRPRYIQGYASSLHWVARYILRDKPLVFKPRAIRSAAEMLYENQRHDIEKAFGAKVYNFYGSREVNNLAAECASHEGLHILESGRIIEIVDNDGNPVSDGTPGKIAVTDLTNLSFPFIRYLNGDIATIKSSPCSCGRGYRLLENILGRSSDIIIVNNKQIHGEYFTHLFYNRPEIKQFQLIQEDSNNIRILIVSDNENFDFSELKHKIHEKTGGNVNLAFELVADIPPLSTGKYRFTISKIAGK